MKAINAVYNAMLYSCSMNNCCIFVKECVAGEKECDYKATCEDRDTFRTLMHLANEKKTGHWIIHRNAILENNAFYRDLAQCSACGMMHDKMSNYCPWCGAEMEEEFDVYKSKEDE